jgi:hypothetical protein
MKRTTSLLALLGAGLVTVLVVAGFSIAAGDAAPTNQSPPTISGSTTVGSVLNASSGSWNGSTPITYAYQWRRCGPNGGSCSNISGANKSTYTLKSADRGSTVRVRVTAKNGDGSAQAESAPTTVVTAPAAPAPTGCPAGTGPTNVSGVSLPARLLVDGQAASPTTITRSTSDLTLRFHVSACGGRPVQGALLYATAVPFSQFVIPPEATTGSDGWASLTMHQDRYFPASSRQQLLVMQARARKATDPVLAGISTQRLVSFPVKL